MASCPSCRFFIADKIGFGEGIGQCRVYEYYKNKKNDGELLRALGHCVPIFYGTHGQVNCVKFEDGNGDYSR